MSISSQSLQQLQQHKRSVELYLRAFWDQGFYLQAQAEESESVDTTQSQFGSRILLAKKLIYLPSQLTLSANQTHYYRTAAMHGALHCVYKSPQFETGDLKLLQRVMIGLVEDLRIEQLAIQRFAGLEKLFLSFHQSIDQTNNSAIQLMARLSRSVLDTDYIDDSSWVNKGRSLIANNRALFANPELSREIGLQLANDMGQMRLPLNAGRYESIIKYRDDNSCLWHQLRHQQQQSLENQSASTSTQNKKLREKTHGRELAFSETETVHNPAQETGHLIENTGEGLEYIRHQPCDAESCEMTAEWDYRSHIYKQNWCRVHLVLAKQTDAGLIEQGIIDQQLTQHKYLLAQLRQLAKRLQMQRRQRRSKLLDGDELDPELMIAAMVALRSQTMPDPRIFMRDENHHSKSLSISVLMDLSESTNARLESSARSPEQSPEQSLEQSLEQSPEQSPGQSPGQRICELMRDAVLLLGETLNAADENFSIAGFNSDGRQRVNYIEYKHASESFANVRHRLAAIRGSYSTRLGAAIRYAASRLAQQPTMKKILLVITDGAPSDIDVFDSAYLLEDSRHAVAELVAMNIRPYCINLDPQAAHSIASIFGAGHYQTLHRIEDLPRVLSAFYIRHVRH